MLVLVSLWIFSAALTLTPVGYLHTFHELYHQKQQTIGMCELVYLRQEYIPR